MADGASPCNQAGLFMTRRRSTLSHDLAEYHRPYASRLGPRIPADVGHRLKLGMQELAGQAPIRLLFVIDLESIRPAGVRGLGVHSSYCKRYRMREQERLVPRTYSLASNHIRIM